MEMEETPDPLSRRSPVRTIRRWFFRCALIFILISVGSVLLFRWAPPPLSSFILQQYARDIVNGQGPDIAYDWAPYQTISPYLALAAIAAEDQKFPNHRGFDFDSIKKALEANQRGSRLRGASTISQQVAKNLFLWPGRSFIRKGLEAWFTLLIETLWPKQRILEMYLNIAQFGERIYGAEAASQGFFRKQALEINRTEAALLASVLPNPVSYRAGAPSRQVRQRQAWILKQMNQLGGIRYLDNL
jgi:monofunctional glycosyltransferase